MTKNKFNEAYEVIGNPGTVFDTKVTARYFDEKTRHIVNSVSQSYDREVPDISSFRLQAFGGGVFLPSSQVSITLQLTSGKTLPFEIDLTSDLSMFIDGQLCPFQYSSKWGNNTSIITFAAPPTLGIYQVTFSTTAEVNTTQAKVSLQVVAAPADGKIYLKVVEVQPSASRDVTILELSVIPSFGSNSTLQTVSWDPTKNIDPYTPPKNLDMFIAPSDAWWVYGPSKSTVVGFSSYDQAFYLYDLVKFTKTVYPVIPDLPADAGSQYSTFNYIGLSTTSDTLYIGTTGGIYRRPISDVSGPWTKIYTAVYDLLRMGLAGDSVVYVSYYDNSNITYVVDFISTTDGSVLKTENVSFNNLMTSTPYLIGSGLGSLAILSTSYEDTYVFNLYESFPPTTLQVTSSVPLDTCLVRHLTNMYVDNTYLVAADGSLTQVSSMNTFKDISGSFVRLAGVSENYTTTINVSTEASGFTTASQVSVNAITNFDGTTPSTSYTYQDIIQLPDSTLIEFLSGAD